MKKTFSYLLCLILVSCFNNDKEKFAVEKEKLNNKNNDTFFQNDIEKITLLSLSKNLPKEQVSSVLKDYYDKTSLILINDESPEYISKVMDTIAKKNKLTIQKTASIVFSYQYELLTNDEIIENYTSEKDDYLSEKDKNK